MAHSQRIPDSTHFTFYLNVLPLYYTTSKCSVDYQLEKKIPGKTGGDDLF